MELAGMEITANAIMAGVTDTPALRKIPGNERLMEYANTRNPHGRLTRPEDVAKCVAVLAGETVLDDRQYDPRGWRRGVGGIIWDMTPETEQEPLPRPDHSGDDP